MLLELVVFGVVLGLVWFLGNLALCIVCMAIIREMLQDKELMKKIVKNNVEITKEVMEELDV